MKHLCLRLISVLLLTVTVPPLYSPVWAAKKPTTTATTVTAQAKHEQAIKQYNQGVKLLQAAQIEQQQRGERGQAATLFQQAEIAFLEALQTDPSLTEAQSNLGYVALYRQQYPEAIKQFKQALKQNNQHTTSLAGLALAYVQLQQAEKALPLFQQLTVLEPENPNAWFNLGSTAQCLNKTQQAESAYRQAITLAPQYQAALFNLATLLENTVNYKDALAFYTQCTTVDAGSLIGLEALKRSAALKLQLEAVPPVVQ